MTVFIYQTSYLKPKKVEEMYQEEYELMKEAGHNVFHIDFDNINDADLSFVKDRKVVYRSWMLTLEEYEKLEDLIKSNGGKLITTKDQYEAAHHLPSWVDKLEGLTPKTHVFKNKTAAIEFVSHNDGHKFFVKDFVKSMRGVDSSIVSHKEELIEFIDNVTFFRGIIEGGLCLREIETFQEDTEERFFVYNGKIHSNGVDIPDIVKQVSDIIDLPFITIDIVLNEKNEWRVVEVGDGQVSDSKKWNMINFPKVFS